MDVILCGIDVSLSREDVQARCMEDGFIVRVALATEVGTYGVALTDIHTVADTTLLTPCQNL
jgi:hypothetical protein